MADARVELDNVITRKTVEDAYRLARTAMAYRRESLAVRGMRAVKKRDPRLLLCLEKGTKVLYEMSVDQFGAQGMETEGGYRTFASEYHLWKAAYEMADQGEVMAQFQWVYGAAAALAGYTD